jgi:hypothetical protein
LQKSPSLSCDKNAGDVWPDLHMMGVLMELETKVTTFTMLVKLPLL